MTINQLEFEGFNLFIENESDNTQNHKMIDILLKYGAEERSGLDVYTDIFKLGQNYIQTSDETVDNNNLKTNPILIMKDEGSAVRRRIMFEDEFEDLLFEAQKSDFAILNGLSYFGRENISANANKMYAMIFDIDDVKENNLHALLNGATTDKYDIYPEPNYVVLSGGGVHLYYVFEEPIPLYPNTKTLLKELKYKLTTKMWNMYTSGIEKRQYQGINQGFRVIGSRTKKGYTNRAFKLNNKKINLEYLNRFLAEEDKIDVPNFKKAYSETKYTLQEAKDRFPEWYERRIVQGETQKKWTVKRDLYDWWKRQILDGASGGHRYFCIMTLAIYAMKCDIGYAELKKDAYDLISFMNQVDPANEFTSNDVESALECYDERYKTFPRQDISKLTAIDMPKNKRNYQNQIDHLEEARMIRDLRMKRQNRNWWDNAGRPVGSGTKEQLVKDYIAENPNKSVTEVARALNVSRPTVYKYR